MDWQTIAMIIFGSIILILIIFRKQISHMISALFYDYVIDGGLSFADNFVAGVGLAGLDIGDWIAAVLIYRKNRKITGVAIALLVAWEATNFLPISLIPVVGEVVETFFGLFPATAIAVGLFGKFKPAEKKEKELKEDISLAKQLRFNVSKENKVLKDVEKLIKKSDPVDALKKFRKEKPIEKVQSKFKDYVNNLISDTQRVMQYIYNQKIQAPQEMINILEEGIANAQNLMQQAQNFEDQKDFISAINAAQSANDIIRAAAQRFNDVYQQALKTQMDYQRIGRQ